ncbi:MAG: VWA domain-containing protein [Verrucomicrobiales bacterium]
MIFRSPEWLAVLPIALVAGWWVRRLGLYRPLRLLCLVLITIILMQPQIRRFENGLDLLILLDRSASTEDLVDKGLPEWRQLLEAGRQSVDDRTVYFDFAGEIARQGDTGTAIPDRSRRLTRTRLAVDHALNQARRSKPSRLLVFTDGFATEPLGDLAEKLAAQSIALDYRLVRPPDASDFRVSRLSTPAQVQVAEPFLIEVEVRGTSDGVVPLVVRRDGQEISRGDVTVSGGSGSRRFTDRAPLAGARRYEAVIEPSAPDRLGNNRYESWVEVTGGPVVLLVTKYLQDPVAAALEKQGFTVQTVTLPTPPQLGQLAGAKAVILNNVPAYELPNDFLRSLDYFVREQGGSLLMAGGRQSFGAGGYFQSAVDSLLPVSMELKTEHRKLSVAMAIVMDRSGSMSMPAGGGGATKMDLANEGAANAIQFLGAQDFLTVFAVDSTAHEMVPLQPVGPNREKMSTAVRRIQSMGGGIFVYEGLSAGWKAIRKTEVGQRHVILFSDAADSEEPGDFENLLEEMRREGATVSVIALGTRGDPDAALLEDIATRGGGRLFFTDQPSEIPSIFSQETIAVARSAFISDPTPAAGAPAWFELAGNAIEWPEAVDGYNLSYLRDRDSQAFLTKDEYAAPLVAFGQRGMGRTAAVSFPLGGEYSERVRAWPKYGDFLQTLARWMLGEELPPGLGLRHRLQGTQLTLDLLSDESWQSRLADRPPRVVIASGRQAENRRELTWRQLAPGHFQSAVELTEGELVRGVVQAGAHALSFGPLSVGTDAEWAMDGTRLEELRRVAAASGGRELLDLSDAWRRPPQRQFSDVRTWLLVGALLAMLADALVTRTGWRSPKWAVTRRHPSPTPRGHAETARRSARQHQDRLAQSNRPEPSPAAREPSPAPPPSPPPPTPSRQSRFDRAKKR